MLRNGVAVETVWFAEKTELVAQACVENQVLYKSSRLLTIEKFLNGISQKIMQTLKYFTFFKLLCHTCVLSACVLVCAV